MMSFYVVVVMVVLMMMVSDENGWVSGVEGSRGVEMRPYGRTSDGRQVVLVALRRGRVRLALTNWGATITSLLLPNAQGTHYIHTYIHTYIMHTCIHPCIHADIHTYMHAYIHAYIHNIHNIHTCIHTYIHTTTTIPLHTCM